ncbi:hypothetical protein LCGC14_1522560 [marine sediment metagenome]|uniref:KTSC domain-containing protein n=1 Tax=marine sediment metagenome TaxID=412755 RepID=A0A0F9LDX0_9ZZZZ
MTEQTDIEMVEVVSSNIHSVGYDADENVLLVRFHGGALYRYLNVPENVYRGFLEAGSAGAFLNTEVKGKYEYEKAG